MCGEGNACRFQMSDSRALAAKPSHSRDADGTRALKANTLRELRGRREDRAPAGTHGPRAEKKHAAEPQAQPRIPAGSSGRRNTGFFHLGQQLVKRLRGGFPSQCLSRSGIEGCCHCGYLISVVDAQICAFREVLSEQPVGVLVGAALPGASWIAEVDLDSRIDLETTVLSHFGPLIPGQRTTQFFGQGDDGARDRIAHGFSSVSRERRSVLGMWTFARPLQPGKMQEHRKARGAFDQRADCRATRTNNQISFPMSRHCSICDFSRTLADHDLWRYKAFASLARARPGHS